MTENIIKTRSNRFNVDQFENIIRLSNLKWSNVSIAEIYETSANRICKLLRRYHLDKDLAPKVKLRSSKICARIGTGIKRVIREYPKIPYRDIPGQLVANGFDEISIPSATTIQRYLKDQGYQSIKLDKKQFIPDAAKEKRVVFAQRMLLKSTEELARIIFSDETMVRKCPKGIITSITVHKSTPASRIPTNPQMQNGGFGVMFWGCFSERAFGPLVEVQEHMDKNQYIHILENYAIPEIEAATRVFGYQTSFMQDNAPCHKAKLVTNFLTNHDVPTIDWPPYSPDLNPIENLWSIVKRQRTKKFGVPRTREELIQQIMTIWDDLDPQIAINLSESFIKRLYLVIESKGEPINY